MNEQEKKRFLKLVAMKIADKYGCTEGEARAAIRGINMESLLDEEPEYVCHLSISSLAESIWMAKGR